MFSSHIYICTNTPCRVLLALTKLPIDGISYTNVVSTQLWQLFQLWFRPCCCVMNVNLVLVWSWWLLIPPSFSSLQAPPSWPSTEWHTDLRQNMYILFAKVSVTEKSKGYRYVLKRNKQMCALSVLASQLWYFSPVTKFKKKNSASEPTDNVKKNKVGTLFLFMSLWRIQLTPELGCCTGPPAYVAWRAGTTILCRSQYRQKVFQEFFSCCSLSPVQLCLEIYISSNSRNLLPFLLRRKEENLIEKHTPFPMV